MKRWRRPLILIALLLLAGAVVNVAVAWGIAALSDPPDLRPDLAQQQSATRRLPAPANWPRECERVVLSGGPGITAVWEESWARGRGHEVSSLAFGAPRRAVCVYWHTVVHGPQDIRSISGPYGGIRAPGGVRWFDASHGRLPIFLILPGFAINTLFYAVVVGAILALPLSVFPIRRRVRVRRGRCPKCGYDLAGLRGVAGNAGNRGAVPCPECGGTP